MSQFPDQASQSVAELMKLIMLISLHQLLSLAKAAMSNPLRALSLMSLAAIEYAVANYMT